MVSPEDGPGRRVSEGADIPQQGPGEHREYAELRTIIYTLAAARRSIYTAVLFIIF